MKRAHAMIGLLMLAAGALPAQDVAGVWQGTLNPPGPQLRFILRVAKNDGGWKASLYSIDQSPDWGAGMAASSFTLQGSAVKFAIEEIRASYEGRLSADGSTMTGTLIQGLPLRLELRRATKDTAWSDPAQHSIQFVTVDKDVKLEVLDWGGTGRPLVMLAGLGNSAHIFDKFAPKLTGAYHVYGVTRRGFGDSSAPNSGYSADRLGEDVLAAINALKLTKPVLAGHSIAGEELSSIGSRHPGKVAGLIYLDAGYFYAYYDPSVKQPMPPIPPPTDDSPHPAAGVMAGTQKYVSIRGPILAIFALPHDPGPAVADNPDQLAAFKDQESIADSQSKAFEKGLPSAKVIRLPNANHFVFISNEADVLREMIAFIGGLKKP
ncbi:MAG TPA: alpha/beta hydrolase [Bryobacteraceae bacterium]|nr:alpha/beta hydrolase [Bryobacteraceae bacterium]